MLPIRQSISARQRNALASVCGSMKMKLEKSVLTLSQNEAFTISSLLDMSMKLRLIDPRSKNRILSTVRTIMESYSLTRDLRDVSDEIFPASMRHEFLRAEMEALLDPSELPQRVGPMEELDLYEMPPPPSIGYRGVALVEDDMYLFNYHIMCFIILRNMLLQNLNFCFFIPMTGQVSYPLLALVAKEFLAVQVASAACERLFSEGR